MKNVLLIGSSYSAAPFLFLLKRMGFRVSVCGALKNDPCHAYADQSFFIDYSKKDELLKLVGDMNFDYIVPTCNDYSYLSGSYVANTLQFPGFDTYETTEILHVKGKFKKEATKLNLKSPKLYHQGFTIDILRNEISYPCLVKPIDSFSGRGVTKVMNSDELGVALELATTASSTGKLVIEEFVEGDLFSHSAYIEAGKVAIEFFADEFCQAYQYQVDCSNHPSKLGAVIKDGVRQEINRMCQQLNLVDGLLHTQFIVNKNEFWLIECMRRCPGDLYGHMIQKSTGINYDELFISPFIGMAMPKVLHNDEYKYIGRHTISQLKASPSFSFTSSLSARDIEVVQLKVSGEELSSAPYDKMAILFSTFSTAEQMHSVVPRFSEFVHINSLD
jgi:formate-dependent phosphoribosylglycinamide formyltransferase (GAR transformylase)